MHINDEQEAAGDVSHGSALPPLAEHYIHLFYISRKRFEDKPVLTFRQLASPQNDGSVPHWIPADVRSALGGRYGEESIWTPSGRSKEQEQQQTEQQKAKAAGDVREAGDLFPYIDSLISGQRPSDAEKWILSNRTLKLLADADLYEETTPREKRIAKNLELPFTSKRARERMAAQLDSAATDALRVRIRGITLYRLCTGVVIADVRLQVERPDRKALAPVELVEAVTRLSRFNALRWCTRAKNVQVEGELLGGPAFSLGEIIGALMGEPGSRAASRVFTYAFVGFAATPLPIAARRLAIQLARHYTDDYALVPEPGRIAAVQDFDNVQHLCALEGAATIVSGGAAIPVGTTPDFVARFYDQTFRKNYLPIALLNLHERAELIDITTESAFWPDTAGITAETLQRLEDIRDRSLKFRLCYRFSEVSHVTMHNALHLAFRQVFGLDRMLQELNQDVVEVDGFLRGLAAKRTARSARENARRWRWISIIGAAGLTWLTTFVIVKEALEVFLHDHYDLLGPIAVVVGLTAGAVAWWKTSSSFSASHEAGGHAHGLTEHAIEEHIKHTALK